MGVNEHPNSLEAFVEGRLNEHETQTILEHLAECDQCLADVDLLWGRDLGRPDGLQMPDLDPIVSSRLHRYLLRRIHMSQLTRDIVLLGTRSLVGVAVALIRPVMNIRRSVAKYGERG